MAWRDILLPDGHECAMLKCKPAVAFTEMRNRRICLPASSKRRQITHFCWHTLAGDADSDAAHPFASLAVAAVFPALEPALRQSICRGNVISAPIAGRAMSTPVFYAISLLSTALIIIADMPKTPATCYWIDAVRCSSPVLPFDI